MDLLAYWKWDVYQRDTRAGERYHFNSAKARLHNAVELGDSIWLVSGRPGPHGAEYVLLQQLVVHNKRMNSPTSPYGLFRVEGDLNRSIYYDPSGPAIAEVLLRLKFSPPKPIKSEKDIPMSIRSMRSLPSSDVQLIKSWADSLKTIDPGSLT